jgi:hypothetical protein
MRAAKSRSAIPVMVVMNAFWSAMAFATVIFTPHRATSALLMTAINHLAFSSIMFWRLNVGWRQILGLAEMSGTVEKEA